MFSRGRSGRKTREGEVEAGFDGFMCESVSERERKWCDDDGGIRRGIDDNC